MGGFYRPGQRDEQRMRRFMSISGAGITGPVVGLDPYFSSVISLLHFEGTSGSTTFTDQKSPTWTATADAQISTVQSRYGSSAMHLNLGGGGYISTTGITSLSASAWTAEISGWIQGSLNSAGENRQIFRAINASGFGVSLLLSVNGPGAPTSTGWYLRLYLSGNGTSNNIASSVYSTVIAPGVGGWYDYAIQFTGTAYEVYFAGSRVLTVSSTTGICPITTIQVGGNSASAANSFYGYMDEWRLTNGVARLTNPYTPSGPFPDS